MQFPQPSNLPYPILVGCNQTLPQKSNRKHLNIKHQCHNIYSFY